LQKKEIEKEKEKEKENASQQNGKQLADNANTKGQV